MPEVEHTESGHVSRRQARRDAMVVLYQHDLTGAGLDDLYKSIETERGYEPAVYTRSLVEGVTASRDELDSEIDARSLKWPSHRLAALERNILRIAVYEIKKSPDIPVETSIDEAVRLAKRYCSREAGSLINGILGTLANETGERI